MTSPLTQTTGFCTWQTLPDDTVSVINGATNTVMDTIPVGSAPYGIAFNSDNGNLYVTNGGGNTVSVITPNNKHRHRPQYPVVQGLQGIAFNPSNGNLYAVANHHPNPVSVINGTTNTVIDTIPVGINPVGVAFNAAMVRSM